MALIPSILMVIGALVFWKFYDLTPEKSKTIRQQLNEIQI
jgi:Na+/melibiose symporter-like transporter